jgi:transposase-like protein
MNLVEAASLSDDDARKYLETLRWPNGPVCPHCQSQDVTRMHGKAHRKGAIQCNACREQFTVTLGTVMESSKVPLRKWVLAFHLLCSSKKGFSALQLQRNLGLGSYKTAWFMLHRIRHAMEAGSLAVAFSGTVEIDETYVGGKPRKTNNTNISPGAKSGFGTKKTPVVLLVERDGRARSKPLERVTMDSLTKEICSVVDRSATLMTDELPPYQYIGQYFTGGHHTVNHGRHEYARREPGFSANVNTAESFFALVKRGHYGVYHQMSKKHLHRYCAEFDFRWNRRRQSDSARTDEAIRAAEGKRLMYETPSSPGQAD